MDYFVDDDDQSFTPMNNEFFCPLHSCTDYDQHNCFYTNEEFICPHYYFTDDDDVDYCRNYERSQVANNWSQSLRKIVSSSCGTLKNGVVQLRDWFLERAILAIGKTKGSAISLVKFVKSGIWFFLQELGKYFTSAGTAKFRPSIFARNVKNKYQHRCCCFGEKRFQAKHARSLTTHLPIKNNCEILPDSVIRECLKARNKSFSAPMVCRDNCKYPYEGCGKRRSLNLKAKKPFPFVRALKAKCACCDQDKGLGKHSQLMSANSWPSLGKCRFKPCNEGYDRGEYQEKGLRKCSQLKTTNSWPSLRKTKFKPYKHGCGTRSARSLPNFSPANEIKRELRDKDSRFARRSYRRFQGRKGSTALDAKRRSQTTVLRIEVCSNCRACKMPILPEAVASSQSFTVSISAKTNELVSTSANELVSTVLETEEFSGEVNSEQQQAPANQQAGQEENAPPIDSQPLTDVSINPPTHEATAYSNSNIFSMLAQRIAAPCGIGSPVHTLVNHEKFTVSLCGGKPLVRIAREK